MDPLYNTTGLGVWMVTPTLSRTGGRAGVQENVPRGNVLRVDLLR